MNQCLQSAILMPLLMAFASTAQIKDSRPVAAKFVDVTPNLGVQFEQAAPHTSKKYLLEAMGSGVALFDYDNHGRLDLFAVNGAEIHDPSPPGFLPEKTGPKYWNRLYHQKADGTFEDVAEKAGLKCTGYGMGVAVDYDNDGSDDLFVTGYGAQSSLPQQWKWHFHGCNRQGSTGPEGVGLPAQPGSI